jgi:hypothetical protein
MKRLLAMLVLFLPFAAYTQRGHGVLQRVNRYLCRRHTHHDRQFNE